MLFKGIQSSSKGVIPLVVLEPADHVIVSRSNSVIKVGHHYELLCQSNGNPLPESVTWFNNSKPIRNTKRVASKYDKETGKATLSISPVTRYDVSTLQCRFEQELSGGQFNYIKSVIHITPTGIVIVYSFNFLKIYSVSSCF